MAYNDFIFLVFCILAFLSGACFGSFSNVLIYRLPIGESIVKGASHCTSCGKKIKFYDNIPLLSFLFLRGKCRACGQKISPRYFFVELLSTALYLGFAFFSVVSGYVYAALAMFFSSALICSAFIDAKHGYIPDCFSIFIALLAVLACFFDSFVSWKMRLFGLAFSLVFFGGAYLISKFIFKKEGLGLGDVKLMASCGLFLGLKSVFFATLVSTVVASVVLLSLSARNKQKKIEYPFAPFLAFGCILAAFVGQLLINAYLALF